MATHDLIDAQFDRAVEIVQGLPKTGPIQTDYEEKLQMYSLYKQATVGNVKSPRPGIWDMLGRAKWDAWAKHKDLDSYEAKWLYVEALLKVLRRYSDKTMAQNLVQELESYGGDPSNLVLSQTSMQSPGSDSSGSTASREASFQPQEPPPQIRRYTPNTGITSGEDESTEGESEGDEAGELRTVHSHIPLHRSHSFSSAHRYQTPLAGSLLSQTPLGGSVHGGVPPVQPLPTFETPSAFPAPALMSTPGSVFNVPAGPGSYTSSHYGHRDAPRAHSQSVPPPLQTTFPGGPVRPASRISLERVIENVQAHLAALTERLETLESRSLHNSASSSFRGSPKRASYGQESGLSSSGRLPGRGSPHPIWDLNDLGMWSYVLNPISHVISFLHKLAHFFASGEDRSPTRVIIRRLCLDLSFLMCVLTIIGAVWKRSGMRRREVKAALVVLWRAIVGNRGSTSLPDRSV
ncbi:ACBP-domain-containing protein [Macrolepiota fuliginosa MF-IS2]|uniref:ACBP-domain-containing protein n=1 Tax=Macrolepiota fuliginosa MF-IS2 TaxID=1400762 RepID=A0A9P5XK94_9AGAR|nr:ACBP-domain-containing protein [Macrolepiota fuliginosa MF-IS2]